MRFTKLLVNQNFGNKVNHILCMYKKFSSLDGKIDILLDNASWVPDKGCLSKSVNCKQ